MNYQKSQNENKMEAHSKRKHSDASSINALFENANSSRKLSDEPTKKSTDVDEISEISSNGKVHIMLLVKFVSKTAATLKENFHFSLSIS